MIHRSFLPLAAALAAGAAGAQAPAPAPVQDAAAPAVPYRSTLEAYQPFNDQPVGAWKGANGAVGRIGGWRAYAKEAQQPEGKPAEAPAAAPVHAPGHKQ